MSLRQADLAAKGTVISGLRGSGKTNLARYISGKHPDAVLVYDPLDQYPEYDVIRPKQTEYPGTAEELARWIKKLNLADTSKHNYRLLVIDEAQLVAPAGRKLHPAISRLNIIHRHYPLAIIWIAQRPRFLHANIINLADHLFLFRLPGATDARYLDDVARGLSERVRELKEWQFAYVDKDRRFHTMNPVPEVPLLGDLTKSA